MIDKFNLGFFQFYSSLADIVPSFLDIVAKLRNKTTLKIVNFIVISFLFKRTFQEFYYL